jgi:hypothetical protein
MKGADMRSLTAWLFCGLVGSASAADNLLQCRAIEDASARLQCYDQYVDASRTTEATPSAPATAVVPSRPAAMATEPVKTARDEALFGTSGETIESKIADLSVQVQSISTDSRQKLVLTMQNGQRWQQLDNGFLKVSQGDNCVISSGVFGSYTMKCQQGTKSIRVKRIR